MNQDDFNMYFRGSFVTTKRGKLAYILEGDGGIVNYEVYTDNETSTRHEVEADEVEAALNLKGFEIKPFKHQSGVYSPSYTTVRGYKDGVTHSRIDFKSVNGLASRDYNELIKAMFFEEIKSVKEGVQDIVSGKKDYASLPGGFLITKKEAGGAEGKDPFSSISVEEASTGGYSVNTPGSRVAVTSNTVYGPIPDKVKGLSRSNILKIASFMSELIEGWEPDTAPIPLINLHLQWLESEKNKAHAKPEIEVYRAGMKICNLLAPVEDVFKGLPRLNETIEGMRDEYNKACRA